MVDNMTPFDPNSPAETPSAAPATNPVSGFINSTPGKILIGGLLVLLLLGVGGYFAYSFLMNKAAETAQPPASSAQTTATPSATASATAHAVEAQEVPLGDVFTFRDIFVVTIEATTTSASTSETAETSSTASTETNVLTLQSISEEDGVKVAHLTWNGVTYNLEVGGVIPGTPWKVVSIGSDSVVMLYGDSTVTLTVGSGIAK